MSAKVVSLFDAHDSCCAKRWTNQDVAEIYRVGASLTRAGLPIECEEGQTDEGDRWYAFCNAKTGDVIVHFALIDDKYVAQVCHLSINFTGSTLSDIVDQFLTTYPVVLPDPKSANANRIWMHPASGLAAFVATLYFLLEMTKSTVVHAAEVTPVTDELLANKAVDDLSADSQKEQDTLHASKQLLRWIRLDNTGAQDAPRMVAIAAAALIAGLLMDSKLGTDSELTFDPKSVLEALDLPALSPSIDGVLEDIVAAAEAQIAKFRAELTRSQDGEIQTSYQAEKEQQSELSDLAHFEKIAISDEEKSDALIIDLGADLGVPNSSIEEHLRMHMGAQQADGGDGAHPGENENSGRHVHTIAATDADSQDGDQDLASPNTSGNNSGDAGLASHDVAAQLFVETAQEISAIAVLQSLGLNTAHSSELDGLAGLISSVDFSSGTSNPAVPSAAVTSVSVVRNVEAVQDDALDTSTSLNAMIASAGSVEFGQETVSTSYSASSASGPVPETQAAPSVPKSVPGEVLSAIAPEPPGAAHEQHVHPPFFANDFSVFDPVEVLRAFLELVEDVGFAEYHDAYFLFDALSVSSQPTSELAFESIALLNGDEVNLIGQASTFDLVRDALETA